MVDEKGEMMEEDMILEKDILNKLNSGVKLDGGELWFLAFEINHVDFVRGEDHRWQYEAKVIFTLADDSQLWALDYMAPLTETAENEFWDQPYKVRKVERQVTITEYVKE